MRLEAMDEGIELRGREGVAGFLERRGGPATTAVNLAGASAKIETVAGAPLQ